jgi:cellulose synthase/poly-beta-1,6-N-acetylglucosamine synthase-like glycosyltransferase
MLFMAITLVLISIIIDLFALILLRFYIPKADLDGEFPKVSILIPMFNEESNVNGLINNLQTLDYPPEKIEILIGEDRSSDNTPELLRKAADHDQRIRVIDIQKDLPDLMGKANVIGQLIPHCTSQLYFITDADVRVPPLWIKTILSNYHHKIGVIGGTTVIPVTGWWSGLQNIDWLLAQGLIQVAGRLFQTVAVSGTNMMVTKSACEAIGGYINIPYPLTEDIGLLSAVKKKGFSGMNLLDAGCTAVTDAQPDISSLLEQRARWTYGALKLPKPIVLLLLIRSIFLLFIVFITSWQPATGIILYILKMLTDFALTRKVAHHIGVKVAFWHFIFFEVYWFLTSMGGLFMHLFSINAKWKGRSYHD